MANHVPTAHGFLCGVKSGSRCPTFQRPTCTKCDGLRAGSRRLYVAMARHLLATRERVSAGEVAFHVHGHATHHMADLTIEAEQALSDAGFACDMRMSARFRDVSLWKAVV